jgi:hypothetical protein
MKKIAVLTVFLGIAVIAVATYAMTKADLVTKTDAANLLAVWIYDDVVTIRLSGNFSDTSCCLVDPETGFIPGFDVDQYSEKDLILEYVSCQVVLAEEKPINLFFADNAQDAPNDMLVPIELTLQGKALALDSFYGYAYHANHQVKVLVDKSSRILLVGRREGSSLGRASCIVTGRLVQ